MSATGHVIISDTDVLYCSSFAAYVQHVLEKLRDAGLPIAPINSIENCKADPLPDRWRDDLKLGVYSAVRANGGSGKVSVVDETGMKIITWQ